VPSEELRRPRYPKSNVENDADTQMSKTSSVDTSSTTTEGSPSPVRLSVPPPLPGAPTTFTTTTPTVPMREPQQKYHQSIGTATTATERNCGTAVCVLRSPTDASCAPAPLAVSRHADCCKPLAAVGIPQFSVAPMLDRPLSARPPAAPCHAPPGSAAPTAAAPSTSGVATTGFIRSPPLAPTSIHSSSDTPVSNMSLSSSVSTPLPPAAAVCLPDQPADGQTSLSPAFHAEMEALFERRAQAECIAYAAREIPVDPDAEAALFEYAASVADRPVSLTAPQSGSHQTFFTDVELVALERHRSALRRVSSELRSKAARIRRIAATVLKIPRGVIAMDAHTELVERRGGATDEVHDDSTTQVGVLSVMEPQTDGGAAVELHDDSGGLLARRILIQDVLRIWLSWLTDYRLRPELQETEWDVLHDVVAHVCLAIFQDPEPFKDESARSDVIALRRLVLMRRDAQRVTAAAAT